ncbi:MAG: HupE/UreJ family protein [Telluria sp.]
MIRLLLAALLFASAPAWAHKPSDAYLMIDATPDGSRITGQWDIALRDLDFAIGLDGDGDGRLTWDEVRARHDAITAYALARLRISSGGDTCTLEPRAQLVDRHTDGTYTVLPFDVSCPHPVRSLRVEYRLFADIDPQHKGLLQLRVGDMVRTANFGVDAPVQELSLADASAWTSFLDYLRDGVWHIWIGFDHILFLVSLLLPAVLVRLEKSWGAAPAFGAALRDVVKVVSAFTLAHSITLAAAALGYVSLPSRWVESAIAASVVIAALNNILPVVHGRRWAAAFAFGLLHGFGFASVLTDLGLPRASLAAALVGFNAGVELGQLAIVAAFLPLAFALRSSWFYRRVVLVGGSALTACVAGVWFAERAFNFSF